MLSGDVMKKILFFISIMITHSFMHASQARNIHSYLWANYQQFAGNYSQSQQEFSNLLSSNPPIYAYKGYLHLLYTTEKFQTIIKLSPKLETSFNNDPEIQLILARALEQTGNQSAADEKILKLAAQFKTEQEIIFQATQLYMRRKEPENALQIIDDLLNNSPRKPNNFIFHFLKAQIYAGMNQPENALKNVKLSLEMHQHFDKGWLLFAALQEQLGTLDEAIKGYTSFLEITGEKNEEVEQHLLALLFKQKVAQQKNSSITLSQTCFEKAMHHFDRKEYSQALSHITKCLEDEKTNNTESRLLKIQILSAMDNYGAAANELQHWITHDPSNQTWYKTLHLLCHAGLSYQKAIAVLEDVSKAHSKNILPLLYLADLHTRVHNNDSALMYHAKAVEMTDDNQLKTKILFHVGLLHYESRNFDAMEKALEKGLSLKMNFPPLLNLLAYHYASQGKALAKAEQLVNTILRKEPNNPHFIDTQALIFYKQKKYEKALSLFQTALKKAPGDATILRHLGKTYYQLGKIDEALMHVKQALTMTPNTQEKAKCTNLLNTWNQHS